MLERDKKRRPKGPCKYEGCTRGAWAQGFCDTHYHRMRREGVLQPRRIVGDPVARFHASYVVDPVTGCWNWTGWIHPNGYGILVVGRKSKKVRAHRFSFEEHVGPIPEGLQALHQCDNRRCVNPGHLFLGDAKANARDMVSKGRNPIPDGERALTDAQALQVRILYAKGLLHPLHKSPWSVTKLASIYRVGQQTIGNLLKGRSYH